MMDVFSFETARKVDVVHEHVARVCAFALARIGSAATPAAEIARAVIALAGVTSSTTTR
jgi:hypothetical protein